MAKEPILHSDLVALCRFADQSAAMMVDYLRKGYTPKEIAQTFSEMFFRRFDFHLDEATAARFPRGSHNEPALTKKLASEGFALTIADAFMKVIIQQMKKEVGDPPPE